MMNNKIEVLRKFLGLDTVVEVVEGYQENCFEVEGSEYIVLTDEEANEKTKEKIIKSLWAFNTGFICKHITKIKLTSDMRLALAESQKRECEGYNENIKNMIDDINVFIENAINADGRGHFLSSYDGNENEEEIDGVMYYIYQIN